MALGKSKINRRVTLAFAGITLAIYTFFSPLRSVPQITSFEQTRTVVVADGGGITPPPGSLSVTH